MIKKITRLADFVKWFEPVPDALSALGGFAPPKEITKRTAGTWKTFSNNRYLHLLYKTRLRTGYIK